MRYGSIGGLEYEVPQSRMYCLCINVALLDGLAMYFSCDTKTFHDNESTHILHNFWTSTHRGEASPTGGATDRGLQRIITCAFSHDTLDRRRCNLTVDEFVDHKNTPRSCCGEIF